MAHFLCQVALQIKQNSTCKYMIFEPKHICKIYSVILNNESVIQSGSMKITIKINNTAI